jgi:hypothetical protein
LVCAAQTRVLNREVRVVLEGVDKHGHLLGSLAYPEGDVPVDLGEKLVSSGLAKVPLQGYLSIMTSHRIHLLFVLTSAVDRSPFLPRRRSEAGPDIQSHTLCSIVS